MSNKLIVFGPTGNVGSIVARTAHEQGAKVFLAMRDPSKPIRGLSSEEEQQGGYERIQADLTEPDTVAAAVNKSGAKRAFIYRAIGSKDHMKSTLEALKSSGIEFVVFLSSFTINVAPKDVPSEEIIPYIHAQVELHLEAIFGDNYVAIRPGAFATNLLGKVSEIHSGKVGIHNPDTKFDWITPLDMGRVSGTILAKEMKDQKIVYLYGPQITTRKEGVQTVIDVLGKQVTFNPLTEQEGIQQGARQGIPEFLGKYLYKAEATLQFPRYEQGVANVQKYTGKPATPLRQWLEANKDMFAVPDSTQWLEGNKALFGKAGSTKS